MAANGANGDVKDTFLFTSESGVQDGLPVQPLTACACMATLQQPFCFTRPLKVLCCAVNEGHPDKLCDQVSSYNAGCQCVSPAAY